MRTGDADYVVREKPNDYNDARDRTDMRHPHPSDGAVLVIALIAFVYMTYWAGDEPIHHVLLGGVLVISIWVTTYYLIDNWI